MRFPEKHFIIKYEHYLNIKKYHSKVKVKPNKSSYFGNRKKIMTSASIKQH